MTENRAAAGIAEDSASEEVQEPSKGDRDRQRGLV
jgi:hypothetical protein